MEKLRIEPNGIEDTLRIEAVTIKTPGLWFLLRSKEVKAKGDLPESLGLVVRGAELNVDGVVMRKFDQFEREALAAGNTGGLTHCGDIKILGSEEYRTMGYATLITDASMEYQFTGERMRILSDWTVRDLAGVKTEMEVVGVPRNVREMAGADPRMSALTVTYRDVALTQRVKGLCSKASGMTDEQYIAAEAGQDDAQFQQSWGFVPGPGIRAAYRRFLTNPGDVRIQLHPGKEVNFSGLRYYKPQDAFDLLHPSVSVNGEAVSDLSFSYKPELAPHASVSALPTGVAPQTTDAPSVTSTPMEVPPDLDATPSAPPAHERDYVTVPIAQLGKHLSAKVRLRLASGLMREGKLLSINNGVAMIERRYAGAVLNVRVPLAGVQTAEVYQ